MSATDGARRPRALALGAAVALGALASACSSRGPVAQTTGPACPRLVAAPATATIAYLRPGGHSAGDLVVGGKIVRARAHCAPEQGGVAVNTEITFYAQRANVAVTDATFPFFVALVDRQLHVLGEQGFKVHVDFIPGESYREIPPQKITVHLPLKDRAAAGNYAVMVGFQLTPEQIAFNRAALAH